ncbi:MAG: hypothetical protein ACTS22_01095 [Phycisphaerales bacterium]
MADENTTNDAGGESKGMPKKLVLIVGAVMALEVLAVGAFLMLTGRAPEEATASVEYDPETDPEAMVEVPVVADRFQNMHTGRVWQWECEIVIQVRRKNEPAVLSSIERRNAELLSGVGELIRKATHSQLREPELQSLKRKLEVYLNEIFGEDADGRDRVERVLIPKLRGAPADF